MACILRIILPKAVQSMHPAKASILPKAQKNIFGMHLPNRLPREFAYMHCTYRPFKGFYSHASYLSYSRSICLHEPYHSSSIRELQHDMNSSTWWSFIRVPRFDFLIQRTKCRFFFFLSRKKQKRLQDHRFSFFLPQPVPRHIAPGRTGVFHPLPSG